ncbi:MAG: translocation/assembly module TamB domain-containing protein [Haemophilus parainfluenzae]|nr:translocation/assembly module TamB domain-containing protein [Haemophilus parainfluenzae]
MSEQEKQPDNQTTQPVKKKKTCRKILCVGSAVIFVPVLGLVTALSFDSGQRALIQLADKMLDSLSIEQVSGGLQDGLVLENLRFQTTGVDVALPKTRLQLNLARLLSGDIIVDDLSLTQPKIAIDTSVMPPSEEKQTESGPMEKIHLPVSVQVKNVAITDFDMKLDQSNITFSSFQSAISLNNESGLTLEPTTLSDVLFSTVSQTQPNTPQPKKKEPAKPVDWAQIEQTLTPAFLGNLNAVNLPFDMHIPSFLGTNWQYQSLNEKGKEIQKITVPKVELQADATDHLVKLQKLDIDSSLGTLSSQGQLRLNEDFPVDLTLKSDLQAFKSKDKTILPASKVDLNLSGSLKKTTALSLTTQGVLDATLTGDVKLAEDKMPLNLQLKAKKGQYAFADSLAPLKINDVDIKLTGDLLNYHAEVVGGVEGMDHIPHTHVDLNVDGKLYEVTINELKLAALDGTARLTGSSNWKDSAQWDVTADLNKMNIRPYVPAMPAVLSGKVSSQGSADSNHWKVDVPTVDLTGSLSSRPLSLKGSVFLSHETLLNIPDLLLNYGDNRIAAKGTLGDKSNLDLDINAPSLRGLWQDLAGSVVGKAQILGKLTAPTINTDLTAQGLNFQGLDLSKAVIKGNVVSEPQVKGELNVKAESFRYGDSIKLHNIDLNASGDEKHHTLTLKSKGEPVAADLQISGNFDRTSQQWKGNLSQVSLNSPIGDFKVNQTIPVTYDNKKIQATIGSHCWINQDLDLCFPQQFTAGKNGEVPFELKRINLDLVNKLMGQDTLKGQLQSRGKVAWFTDKPLQLNVAVEGNNIGVAQKLDYRTFKLDIPKLSVNADIQNNNLTLKSDINVQNQGRIGTDLKINDLSKGRQLGGTFTIGGLRLSLANQLFSSGESLDGEVVSRLSFGGNLEKPLLNGNFDIRNVKTKLKSLPFDVTDGQVAIRFNGTSSTLNGHVQTPDSKLNINGQANWAHMDNWTAEVRAQADNFKVDIPSMAKLKVSPNVVVKASPKLLDLSGNVDIPWARIAIESLPDNAEPVSEDEVILNGPRKSKEELINRQFASETYASFGQDLLIRKGQISFSGLPSQPMLNIEAIRNPEAMEDSKVTAGVKVIGLASSPQVTIFSDPAKPQDQALSYLLTGRSLENSGEAGSSGSVGAALLGLGLAKSGKVVSGIGEAFGIQDLNLGTAGVGDSSKVQVSGNIGKRLQVKYGVGLFDGLAEVTLRYRLMPQLYFQSVSSTNQVFDLLYQFEF